MAAKVTLNGNDYALRERAPIEQGVVDPLPTAFRTVGTQRRSDNAKVNRFPTLQGFPLGVGYQRMDRESGHGVGGLNFSSAQTRWRTISLGYLHESQTHSTRWTRSPH